MWTFSVISFLVFLTLFTTIEIVDAISFGFWQWSITRSHVLIAMRTTPEIDTTVYIASLLIGVCLFFIYFQFTKYLLHNSWFKKVVTAVNYTCVLYALFFTVDRINLIALILCSIIGIFISRLKHVSPYIFEGLVGLVLLRYSIKPLIEFDIGTHKLYTFDNFLRYIVPRAMYPVFLGILLVCNRRIRFVQNITAWLSLRRLSVLIAGSIGLSLLNLMTRSYHPSDIFFTMLPAYHAIYNGTLLVSMMSQYGLLYLAPWIVLLRVFPQLPVNFPIGVCISAFLLCIYFLLFIRITSVLIPRRVLFMVTVVASYYFTILVRFTRFSDMVSVVSTPAFTPLRFGMFIFPLWFLLRLQQTGNGRYMRYFIVCSVVLFFYSFEIGTGTAAVALLIMLFSAITQKHSKTVLFSYIRVFIGTFLFCLILILCYTLLSASSLPDFSMYWYFAKLFGSGFLTTPIGEQTVGLLPLSISLIGVFIGFVGVVKGKHTSGIIMCYLALVELVMLPYYMGRSMNQTIYSISLPFLLLCALLVEYGVTLLKTNRHRFSVLAMVIVCGIVLVTGFARGFVLLTQTALRGPEVIENAILYMHRAFTMRDIQKSQEYMFLSGSMPHGCPLIIFDEKEFELIPALGVPPAFQYPFVYGFITTKEQVDALVPYKGVKEICVFVSKKFLKKQDMFSYGMYTYFFGTHKRAMRILSEDTDKGFTLYLLSTTYLLQ